MVWANQVLMHLACLCPSNALCSTESWQRDTGKDFCDFLQLYTGISSSFRRCLYNSHTVGQFGESVCMLNHWSVSQDSEEEGCKAYVRCCGAHIVLETWSHKGWATFFIVGYKSKRAETSFILSQIIPSFSLFTHTHLSSKLQVFHVGRVLSLLWWPYLLSESWLMSVRGSLTH